MRFLSLCSGIEAASVAWNPHGWKAAAFSEIESFPCSVLAHHYPDVPNLGDMTKFQEWPDLGSVDLLCGGTPCQSFSVAGLRAGLADPRGNLMLTFGAIAAKYRPRWLVWENVPGVLSSNGGRDFGAFLDMLETLGYVCDVDILDAQFSGVPQRRRRVFVCAQHRDDLLNQKTDTSALTIAQALQEISLCILDEASSRYGSAQESSASPWRSRDGLMRRMRLFGLDEESGCWPTLLENLVEAARRCQPEPSDLDVLPGGSERARTPAAPSMALQKGDLFTLTEASLKSALGDLFGVMRLFTTSTATNSITPAQIFICSRAVLLIAKLTLRLNLSSPAFWGAASSSLTAAEEFTDYARSTSSDLFGDMGRVQAWGDLLREAEPTNDALIDIGIECFGQVFPLADSLSGHPAPSRKARQDYSGSTGDGLARCVTTGEAKRQDWETCNLITHALTGEGFDASEDGTGRGTPLVPVAFHENQRGELSVNDTVGALNSGGGKPGQGYPAIAFDARQSNELQYGEKTGPLDTSGSSMGIHVGMRVRRLTPRECERLQGFPDGYTNVMHRGKPAADGPRYKALGNSWAVPVVRWIGQRIDAVDAVKERDAIREEIAA